MQRLKEQRFHGHTTLWYKHCLIIFPKRSRSKSWIGCRSLLHNLLSLSMIITFIIGRAFTESWLCQPHMDFRFPQMKILAHRACALFFWIDTTKLLTWMCLFILTQTIYGRYFPLSCFPKFPFINVSLYSPCTEFNTLLNLNMFSSLICASLPLVFLFLNIYWDIIHLLLNSPF